MKYVIIWSHITFSKTQVESVLTGNHVQVPFLTIWWLWLNRTHRNSMDPALLYFHLSNWIYFSLVKWNESVYNLISDVKDITACMQSLIQRMFPLLRSIIIWLKTMFTAYWLDFYQLYDTTAAFHPTKSIGKSCFMFGNLNIDLSYISASFSWTLLGAEYRRENLLRKSPLELYSNYCQENPFMHPGKQSPKNPQTDKSSTQ